MGINTDIDKLITELSQARGRVAVLETELKALRIQLDEGLAAQPVLPTPRKPRSDAGKPRTPKPENPQPSPPDGRGRPRKPKRVEDTTTGELTPEKANESRVKLHILCPACSDKPKCVKTFEAARDCWNAR